MAVAFHELFSKHRLEIIKLLFWVRLAKKEKGFV